MKRLRSYGDDLDSIGEKGSFKDWERRDRERDRDLERSSSHRRFYSKPDNGGRSRVIDDDRESSRSSRKRIDYEFDGFDRRKSSDRYRESRESMDRGVSLSSPRDRMHRSESFSGCRREFPKGYISERERERERSRREESVSSWRRLSGCKDVDEDHKLSVELGRGSRVLLEDRVNVRSPQSSREIGRSPQGSRDLGRSPQSSRDAVKSPPGSKDSWSEQSKSADVKRSDEMKEGSEQSKSADVKRSDEMKEGSSSSSEMEEGELEPEPEPESESKPEAESKSEPESSVQPNLGEERSFHEKSNSQDFLIEKQIKSAASLTVETMALPEKKLDCSKEQDIDESKDQKLEKVTLVMKGIDELQECHEASANGPERSREMVALDDANEEKEENVVGDNDNLLSSDHTPEDEGVKEEGNDEIADKSLHQVEGPNENFAIDIEVHSKDLAMEENRKTDKTLVLMTDTLYGKDKGKSVALSPSNETNYIENSQWLGNNLLSCRDDAMEGPSSRGFELFSSSTVTRPEKISHSAVGDGKLKTEPLELSLGLPNVLLPLASYDHKAAPSSPSRASVQSLPNTFRTSSDGFSGSMSFSGSQTFMHNPSCSLTQNSFENYEQSVGSRPLFQGMDQAVSHMAWAGQSLNEPNRVEPPNYQRSLNGNNSHPSQTSQGIIYPQALHGQQRFRLTEGSSIFSVAQDRQSNLHRQLSGLQSKNHIEVRSPTSSVGSREPRPDLSKDKKHTMNNGSLHRSSSQSEMDQLVIGGVGFVERIITMIVSEPVQVMARRIEEMAEQSLAFLKRSACDMIVNKDKRGQLHAFQEILQKRSDLTVELLSKSHHVQLEILVAFKTGLEEFLKRAGSIPLTDLAEIYHNLKCRNLTCLSPLPVDDCDCKVCEQKNGFCSACMCLLCAKFDMAQNTCSWVGCDVCLHWCHTDCGLQKSYIRNGRSVGEVHETTEMQFHCVACAHPSEMFGFVKEVFKTCAKEWRVETLSKELEYVKRIFSASSDPRGKQLHIIADQMIARLEVKSNLSEVYTHIMRFLTESDAESGNTPPISLKEIPPKIPGEDSSRVGGSSQVAMWLTSASTENTPLSAGTTPLRSDWDQMVGRSGNLEQQVSVGKMPVVDELESIVRIKQAEAKMFQARADDARREAEGLKRIAVAKNEKIEEEYSSRVTKLRLAEAEERRKQKLDELKLMEREHREFFSMKMRMESDIRVLLLKMEATRRNF